MRTRKSDIKKYNLALPQELFDKLQEVTDRQHTTVVELLRKFIKLGLIVIDLDEQPDAALIIREGDKEREVVFL